MVRRLVDCLARLVAALALVGVALADTPPKAADTQPKAADTQPKTADTQPKTADTQLRTAGGQPAPVRLALVIGNADYAGAPLPTSVNDAGLVAETLAQIGFDVTAMANVDADALARTVEAFEVKARAAPSDAVIVVYLAGYGLQVGGDSFFVPVAAKITRGSDVPGAALRLADLTKAIEAVPAKAHVFIEDLARETPYAMADGMPLAGGLALAPAPEGSLYALNAAPGAVAPAEMPPYGAYARALAEMIQTPGLDLPELFARVRLRVGEYTNGAAVPFADARLASPVALSGAPPRPGAAAEPPITDLSAAAAYSEVVARDTLEGYAAFVRAFPADPLTPRVRMLLAVRREALFWLAASRVNDASAYWTYMRRYQRLAHYFDARRRLMALDAPLEPPPRFDITLFPDVPPPSPEEVALLERPVIVVTDPDWPPIPPPPPSLLPPSRAAFTDELAPPPLAPAAVLPVPTPVALPKGATPVPAGRVTQPFVPRMGEVLGETRRPAAGVASVTVTSSTAGLLSRTAATTEKDGTRTITQTGPRDAILSRVTIIGDTRGATVVQTGPNGGVMTKSVTWTASDGARSTLIRNGGNQIVADIKRNEQGIVVSATSAAAPAPRVSLPTPVSAPGVPAPASPPAAAKTVAPPGPKGIVVPVAPTAVPPPPVAAPKPPGASLTGASLTRPAPVTSPAPRPPSIAPPVPASSPRQAATPGDGLVSPPAAKPAPAEPPPRAAASAPVPVAQRKPAPLPVRRPAAAEAKPKRAARAAPPRHPRARGRSR